MAEKKQVACPVSVATATIIGVCIGVVLLIIGVATTTAEAIWAVVVITPLALFSGGLLLKEENSSLRLGMFVVAAVILLSYALTAFSMAIGGTLGGW